MSKKEHSGSKTKINIQCQVLKPINPVSLRNIPKHWLRQNDGLSKKFTHLITVDVKDIETKDKLAFVIRKHFGFGTFNILFFSLWNKNKNYNPRFRCRTDKCLAFRNGKCNNTRLYNIYKHNNGFFLNRKAIGWSCRVNPKYRPRMTKRAKITIVPTHTMSDIDFKYVWDRKCDLMYRFQKWFWRGGR